MASASPSTPLSRFVPAFSLRFSPNETPLESIAWSIKTNPLATKKQLELKTSGSCWTAGRPPISGPGRAGSGVLGIQMSRALILLGLILVAAGLLWRWIGPLKLGRLPGDIVIEHQSFSFYFPITSGLLISAVLSLILWLINR